MFKRLNHCLIALFIIVCSGCVTQPHYDLLIKNGQIIDGSGGKPYQGNIGIKDEKIVAIGELKNARGKTEIDASNLSVASFIGNANLRLHTTGFDTRSATDAELQQMKTLIRQAMEEGAMGMSSALIYAPSSHSDTSELIALAKVVSEYGGMYVSHIRGEDYRLHKLTTLPATNLKLKKRGALKEGYFADITIFDANKIQDHATFEKPHQYATGMVHVFVNGTQVLKDGEHTGNKPGKFVRGPGWSGG